MLTTIAWWDLSESAQTIDSLRSYLRNEAADAWAKVPGLLLKLWIADREGNRWGAVMLWESAAAAARPLPPHRALELIGYPPRVRVRFSVEAAIEGIHDLPSIAGIGPALAE